MFSSVLCFVIKTDVIVLISASVSKCGIDDFYALLSCDNSGDWKTATTVLYTDVQSQRQHLQSIQLVSLWVTVHHEGSTV